MANIVYGNDEARRKNEQVADILSFGLADVRGQSAREKAAELIDSIQTPQYDLGASFQAPGYVGDFKPTQYMRPEEAQFELAQDSVEGRAAQLAALQAMGEQSNQAIGSQQDLDRVQAMQDAAQFAQGREGAIRQDAARRGQIGGAADMVMRAQAAQDAANRNQLGGLQSAQMAALQRLAGTQAQAGLAGQLRGQDQNLAMSNADIINRFNMFNTGSRNQTNAANVDLTNKAGMRNLDARQGINNAVADAANSSLSRRDQLMGQGFQNQMQKYGGVANALGGLAQGAEKQGDNQRDLLATFARFYGAGAGGKR